MSADKLADRAESIAAAVSGVIRGALIGQPPEVQGAILADLTATWLAGHQGPGAEDAARRTFGNAHRDRA